MVLVPNTISRGELQKRGWDVIRKFVEQNKALLSGRTLDFGCGLAQQYRDLVSGEYFGYDPNVAGCKEFPDGTFDAILATSSFTYVHNPWKIIEWLRDATSPGGHWIITYNSSWYEFEPSTGEVWRFAKEGMERLLRESELLFSEPLLAMKMNGWQLNLTYGIVVRWPSPQ